MYKAIIDFGSCAIKLYIYEYTNDYYKEVYVIRFKLKLFNLFLENHFDENHMFFIDWSHIMRVIKNYGIALENVLIFATSALRTYKYADLLCGKLEDMYGVKIQILEGRDEATLMAIGVISASPDVSGLIIDLGGGSIELAMVDKNKVLFTNSYELNKSVLNNFDHIIAQIGQVKNIYLIGGLFRVISKRYMKKNGYSLSVLHNYSFEVDKFAEYIKYILNNGLYLKHEVLGYNVLKVLLQNTMAKRIIISNYGLKDGVKIKYLLNRDYLTYYDNLYMIREKTIGLLKESVVNSYKRTLLRIFNLEGNKLWNLVIEDYLSLIAYKLADYDLSVNKKILSEFILFGNFPYTHKHRILLYLLINEESLFNNSFDFKVSVNEILNTNEQIYVEVMMNLLNIIYSIQGTFFIECQVRIDIDDNDIRIFFRDGKVSSYIFKQNLQKLKYISEQFKKIKNT